MRKTCNGKAVRKTCNGKAIEAACKVPWVLRSSSLLLAQASASPKGLPQRYASP